MESFDFKHFVDTLNFDQLLAYFQSGQYTELLDNKLVWLFAGLFAGLIAYPKTREVGTMALGWTLVGIVYGVGGLALKNSVISQPGPFILALSLAMGAAGYFIWTKLLNR